MVSLYDRQTIWLQKGRFPRRRAHSFPRRTCARARRKCSLPACQSPQSCRSERVAQWLLASRTSIPSGLRTFCPSDRTLALHPFRYKIILDALPSYLSVTTRSSSSPLVLPAASIFPPSQIRYCLLTSSAPRLQPDTRPRTQFRGRL